MGRRIEEDWKGIVTVADLLEMEEKEKLFQGWLDRDHLFKNSEEIVLSRTSKKTHAPLRIPKASRVRFLGEIKSELHPDWSYLKFTSRGMKFGLSRKDAQEMLYQELPETLSEFPTDGFLHGQIGPSKRFRSAYSSSQKDLYCSPCGQIRRVLPDEDGQNRKLFNLGGLQIVDNCCGKLLDILYESGFPLDVVERAIKHPDYQTSKISLNFLIFTNFYVLSRG